MNTNHETVTLNGKELKAIAYKSPTAEGATYQLGLRKRLRTFSDVNRLKYDMIKDKHKVVESDYQKFWDDLEKAGMGVMIYGRNGKPSRFQWHYNLKAIAEAALDGHDINVIPLNNKSKKPIVKKEAKDTKEIVTRAVHHVKKQGLPTKQVFVFLRNELLEFNIPSDVTKDEMDTIFKALRAVA